MSYEGYTQIMCSNGHLSSRNCWEGESFSLNEENKVASKCKIPGCDRHIVWTNEVDQTNGPDEGVIYSSELTIAEPEKTETCQCCGHVKVLEPVRYKVPTREETQKLRHYSF